MRQAKKTQKNTNINSLKQQKNKDWKLTQFHPIMRDFTNTRIYWQTGIYEGHSKSSITERRAIFLLWHSKELIQISVLISVQVKSKKRWKVWDKSEDGQNRGPSIIKYLLMKWMILKEIYENRAQIFAENSHSNASVKSVLWNSSRTETAQKMTFGQVIQKPQPLMNKLIPFTELFCITNILLYSI